MPKGVGVYVGRNEVIAVSVVLSPQVPRIKSYVIETIGGEDAGEPAAGKEAERLKKLPPEARAIRIALEKIKEPGAYVTAAVSPSHVVTRHFVMPAVPRKEESKAVLYEASRYLPFKLSELVLDYQVLTTFKKTFSVTATAVKKDILYQTLADLRAASAKVLMVEPVSSAVSRAFGALNALQKAKAFGFVIVQSDGSVNLTFADQGAVYLAHDFLLTGAMEEDKNRFFEELKNSLDYFYKLTGGNAIQQVFLAGQGDLKFWVEYLEQTFNYSLRFDFANFQAEKEIPQDVLNAVLVAYGLALRSLNYRSPLGEVRLLPFEERRSKPVQLAVILASVAAAILGVFLVVRLLMFQPYVVNLKNQNALILGPGAGIDPQIAARSAEELSAERVMLAARVGILEGFTKKKDIAFAVLSTLGQGLPQSIGIDSVSLEETPVKEGSGPVKKRLNLRGICYLENAEKEANTVNAWVKSLGGKRAFTENFSEIKLDEIKREMTKGRSVTRFRVICE